MTRLLCLFAICLGLLVPPRAGAETVTVFAAASLRDALEQIAAGYPDEVVLSYGGSGTMARQVAAGAPADVVVLASTEWTDWLADQGALPRGRAVAIARNGLVVIGPAGAADIDPATLPARLGDGRLAMGQRDAVPAGAYARQWLENAGLWEALSPRLAETDNVRAALALVSRGQAPYGVVYRTDALADVGVGVVFDVPDDLHDPILYPAAALTNAGDAFLTYLAGPEAAGVLAAHGFLPVGG